MKIDRRRGLAPAAVGLAVVSAFMLGGGYIYIHPLSGGGPTGTHTIPAQSSTVGETVNVRVIAYYQTNGSTLVGAPITLTVSGNTYSGITPVVFSHVPVKTEATATAKNTATIFFWRWAEGQTNSFNASQTIYDNTNSYGVTVTLTAYYNVTASHMTMTTVSTGSTASTHSTSASTQTVTISTSSTHSTTATTTTTTTHPTTSTTASTRTSTTTIGGSSIMGVMIPLYMDPGTYWNELESAKLSYPSVPVVGIINPDNGPGSSSDSTYVSGVNTMKGDGIIVIGYVDTMEASVSISSAEAQIYDYRAWYNVNGIFFDNMPDVCGSASYYQTLSQYSNSIGLSFTVGNPGAQTCTGYVGTESNLMVYETDGLPSLSTVQQNTNGGPASGYSMIATSVSLPSQSYFNSIYPYMGYVWFTNQAATYQQLPSSSYLDSELAECAAAS